MDQGGDPKRSSLLQLQMVKCLSTQLATIDAAEYACHVDSLPRDWFMLLCVRVCVCAGHRRCRHLAPTVIILQHQRAPDHPSIQHPTIPACARQQSEPDHRPPFGRASVTSVHWRCAPCSGSHATTRRLRPSASLPTTPRGGLQ